MYFSNGVYGKIDNFKLGYPGINFQLAYSFPWVLLMFVFNYLYIHFKAIPSPGMSESGSEFG